MKLNTVVALACAVALSTGLAMTSFSGVLEDNDSDGVFDPYDNCVVVANPGQRDDNEDGYGNTCDADVSDDCVVGLTDLALVGANWGASGAPWASTDIASYDIDEDNSVGLTDLATVGARWGTAPGPSGLACRQDCSGGAPGGPVPIGCTGGNP
jgi:hypothetical protein